MIINGYKWWLNVRYMRLFKKYIAAVVLIRLVKIAIKGNGGYIDMKSTTNYQLLNVA